MVKLLWAQGYQMVKLLWAQVMKNYMKTVAGLIYYYFEHANLMVARVT